MKDQHRTKSIISRRKFITTLGLAAGVSTVPTLMPAFIKNRANSHLRIGVLLPPSNIYPAMSRNFMAGMMLSLDQIGNRAGGREIILQERAIGFGPNSAVQQSRLLIEPNDVDLMTGIVDMAVNKELRQLFHDNRRFLIANQVGANLIQSNDYSPFIVHNTLDQWRANRAMGNWAACNLGKRAFLAASFYESGYDALYAFNLGYENGGGEIVRSMVNNLPAEAKDIRPLLKAIEKSAPDLVFASYSGVEAVDFIQAYQQAGFSQRIPLLGSAFMVDETQLPAIGSAALGIKSCFPWSATLNQRENRDFYHAYTNKYRHHPDSFAVLGFETAQMIAAAVNQVNGDIGNSDTFAKALNRITLNTPRGRLIVNPANQTNTGQVYLREVRSQGNGFVNDIIETVEICDSQDGFALESDSVTRTGWLNPYLCA